MKAVYAGSFDPITLGHLDIIKRACKIFDKVLILVAENHQKSCKISIQDRINLIIQACQNIQDLEVMSYSGLVVDFAKDKGYEVLIRGIRGAGDFETELEMSQINHALSQGMETLFLMTSPECSFIRASRVWELLDFGAKIDSLVPPNVVKFIEAKTK